MFRLSAKKIVLLAALCFIGLVMIQLAWTLSAYESEVALYKKAQRQFEAEWQTELARNAQLKAGLRNLLDTYRQKQSLGESETDWFHFDLVLAIDLSPRKLQYGVYVDGISIIQHRPDKPAPASITTIITNRFQNPDSQQIDKAGKLCINCLLGLQQTPHDHNRYQLLLFYKNPEAVVFDKLGLLVFGSLFFLIILGFLFREIVRRHRQEKNLAEAKNDFINNLTHEMQTPVFAIQMANRLLKEKTGDRSDIAALTMIVEKETSQLKQHATKILDLATLENEQVELQTGNFEVNNYIKEKLHTIQLMLENKGGMVVVKYDTTDLYAQFDKVHLNNVLMSLVDNAIKYNDRKPELRIETGEKGDMIYITLKDNGIGIEPEYLPYVFEKFYRAPNVKRAGMSGFGLGLCYAKQIIRLHKGDVAIESKPGEGTRISIYLPRSPRHA